MRHLERQATVTVIARNSQYTCTNACMHADMRMLAHPQNGGGRVLVENLLAVVGFK